ncbi:MAG: hypothetical protein ACR5LD_01560 [Symbiopectobacterium sp.]
MLFFLPHLASRIDFVSVRY